MTGITPYLEIAAKRIPSILARHGVATGRTLEHKIADAGPYDQRVNPHIINPARQSLVAEGLVNEFHAHGATWYYNHDTDTDVVAARLAEQAPILAAVSAHAFTTRVGQALEIAVARGLATVPNLDYLGGYSDLDEHDDSTLYRKDGPPSHRGNRTLPNQQKLDFLFRSPGTDIWGGIEVKNVRSWLYPSDPEIAVMLRKCITLDVVPILVARRIPFVTGRLLRRCGCITWETLRQRYPTSAAELAAAASHKLGLGYSDITLGNHCDAPLGGFLSKLPSLAIAARPLFDNFSDLLGGFAFGDMPYDEFSARVRRRTNGTNEDFDESEDEDIPF